MKNLAFRPRNTEHAKAIQLRLIQMGCEWTTGDKHPKNLEECVDKGLCVLGGKMWFNPDFIGNEYTIATLDDLYDPDFLIEEMTLRRSM